MPPLASLPDDLTHVPGFVADVMEYALATASAPNRARALAGALALQGHLAADKVHLDDGTHSNLHLAVVADSGLGKPHPARVNRIILHALGQDRAMSFSLESRAALWDILAHSSALLYQTDDYALAAQDAADERLPLDEAVLSLQAEMTPDAFRRVCANPSARTLLARTVFIDANAPLTHAEPARIPVPEHILGTARRWLDRSRRAVVPANLDAARALDAWDDQCTAIRDQAANAATITAWASADRHVAKLALVYAVSANPFSPHVTLPAVEWAIAVVRHSIDRLLAVASNEQLRLSSAKNQSANLAL